MPCTLLACWSEGHDEPWLVLTDLPPEASHAVWYGLRTWIEQGFKIIKGGGWFGRRKEEGGRMRKSRRIFFLILPPSSFFLPLWLVMSVATLWVVALGVEDEVEQERERARKELQRMLQESEQQTQERLERERVRREKQKAALEARRARREAREKAKREARQARRAAKGRRKEEAAPEKEAKPSKRVQGGKGRTHRVYARGLAVLSALWQRGENRLPRHLHPEPWPLPCRPTLPITEEEFLSQKT
jgi:hypothetical protein